MTPARSAAAVFATSRVLLTAVLVAASIASPDRRAEAWQTVLTEGPDSYGYVTAVAVDAAGDVIVAGNLGSGPFGDFAVAKLSGATGAELWRRHIQGTALEGGAQASAVAVDAAGDVLAAGTTSDTDTGFDFIVVKLARDNGNELWRQRIDGTITAEDTYYADFGTALAVDAAGDVVAAGQTANVATGPDFTVVKLAGGTGALRWQRDVNGLGIHFGGHNFSDHARAVAIDAAGDVVAAGVTQNVVVDYYYSGNDFTVVKLAGADGSELWRSGADSVLGFDSANAVAVDLDGNVLSAGNVEIRPGYNGFVYDGFVVRKLAGTSGALLWEQFLSSPTSGSAQTIGLEPNGDVVAAGSTGVFAVARFSGATGAELWRHESAGYYSGANVVAVDHFGDVIAAGTDVVKLSGATGAELWRLGRERYTSFSRLALDAAGNPIVGGAYDSDAGSSSCTVLKLFGTTGGTFPCGDGVLDPIDQCDDGNLADGDGCDSNCTSTACGNGIVTSGETCDDGNLTGADGCDVDCLVELGWSCVHEPSFCHEVCGDGVLTMSETCDDANVVDGDGCDSNCTPTACGNDVVTSGETCDDGNLVDNDGCNADCTRTRCGDGFLRTDGYYTEPEECDDGNPVDGDGCDSNCKLTRCGNGVATAGEECDDGNLAERDGCSPTCTVQCDPYAGRRGCRRRFHVARAFQPGVPSYFPSGADALAVLAPDVVVGDRYGGHADLFSADPSAATFGGSLHAFALPRGAGPIAALGADLLVARTGAAFRYDRAGALLRTYRLPHGGEPAAIAGSADWVAVGVPERQAVYLFDAAGGALIQTLTANLGEGARFGFAVALGANGAVAVGAPGVCPGPGVVYLYDGATGAVRHTIANPDPVLDGAACADSFRRDAGFGHAVATVGADFVAGNPIAAAAYRFDGTSGALLTTFLPAPGRAGDFGASVAALGADVLVGAPGIHFRDDSYQNGMAYLFDGASAELLWAFHNPTFERDETETFGAAVAGVGGTVVIGDPRDYNDTSGSWGTAYVFIDTTACGNATLDPGEQCDDGNLTNGDGCDQNCATTGCGNSVVTAGEVCDDGDRVNGDHCDSDCTISRCGNGLVPPYTEFGEECDDANALDGDGCSACRRDPGWGCGGEPSVCAQCGAGTARVEKPRLVIRHIDTAAEDDTLRLRGELVLPSFDPPLDLARSGFRLIVATAYRTLLDVTVPGGRFTHPPGAGWTADRRGTHWRYRDRGAARHGGITRVLMHTTAEPGHLRFRIEGAAGAFAVSGYELPLEIQLMVDPGAPELGQCAEVAVPDLATGVRCSFTTRNRGLSCQ